MTEHQEQVAVVRWLRMQGEIFFAVPNGGHRRKREAAQLKNAGVTAGVADIIIVLPRGGIALEMKREGGKVSAAQADWGASLPEGWRYVVGYGAEDAIQKLEGLR